MLSEPGPPGVPFQVPNAPTIGLTSTRDGEPSQKVDPCFAGKPSSAVVKRDQWSPRVVDVMRRAADLPGGSPAD